VLLCMSQEAARKYLGKVRPETIVIVDSGLVPADIPSPGRVIRLTITETAVRAGGKVVANTVALSALNAIASLVDRTSLAQAIAARVPARFRELNRLAGEAGEALGREAMAGATA